VFGDQPAVLVRDVKHAGTIEELAPLVRRSRALALQYLTGAGAVEWLASFLHIVDAACVERTIALTGADRLRGCWSFAGSSGRAESLTSLAPHVVLLLEQDEDLASGQRALQTLVDALSTCGYLPRVDLPFEPAFYAAGIDEWRARYLAWIRDPVREQAFRARSLFDLRPAAGGLQVWRDIGLAVTEAVDRAFVQVLANDCLANLPPLTFFEDAVVDGTGEHNATFRLERNAVRPLVDVGRVFGLAARQPMGRSTLERFSDARRLVPEHDAVFREAADTFRIVLWQQGRVGIAQGTTGAELPPSLLSRNDRQVLKSGFRSILRLLELTADPAWLGHL
jgi:CBS domain-containing protein